MRTKKEFKTIPEQIEIMQNKGLKVLDIDKTSNILLRENYFFLVGYRHPFIVSVQNQTYIKDATFEELYSLFKFDRQFRNIIFKNLLIVENNMKSIFSYQLSKKYGYKEKDYLKINNFTNDRSKYKQVNDVIMKMKRQIRNNSSKHSATAHYALNYGYIPLWILVKLLSFGIIGELFLILKTADQDSIASVYDLKAETLERYLPILSNYRNLCAHEDILYDHKTDKCIPDNKYHQLLNIPMNENEYIYGKDDIFSVIIMLKYLLTTDEFNLMINEIDYDINELDMKINSIPIEKILNRMGFPVNWKEIKNMD